MAGIEETDHADAMAALFAREQLLQSVLAASADCIKVLNLEGLLIYMNDSGRLVMEVPADADITGRAWTDLWGTPFKADAKMALDRARSGATGVFQGYAETFSGTKRYWDVRVTPMLGPSGSPERILVVSRDISYLKKVEEEREHLSFELEHRLKNAFSVVQSIIGQTLRRATTLDEGRRVLSDRIRALANAQDILTRSTLDAMTLTDVVIAALAPHDCGDGRITVTGPQAQISGKQGLGLSLALHELVTNATKYGALSTGDGRIDIKWTVGEDGAFAFDWLEIDGPVTFEPTASGFGSVLIRQVIGTYFDGSASLDILPEGAIFRLDGTIGIPNTGEAPDPF